MRNIILGIVAFMLSLTCVGDEYFSSTNRALDEIHNTLNANEIYNSNPTKANFDALRSASARMQQAGRRVTAFRHNSYRQQIFQGRAEDDRKYFQQKADTDYRHRMENYNLNPGIWAPSPPRTRLFRGRDGRTHSITPRRYGY